MKNWNERPREIAYLLNPAFCSRILYSCISYYEKISEQAFPFPLVYLILPLILHKPTRESINSRTQFLIWIQRYPELLIDYPKRTRNLVPITNESLEFLLQTKKIFITEDGKISTKKTEKALSNTKFTNQEIKECLNKSRHIAKWFFNASNIEIIYINLGVRP